MTLSDFASRTGDTLKGIVKIAVGSRRLGKAPEAQGNRIIILGNGPSLRTTITNDADTLRRDATMAVNFMANTPEFIDLRPRYYILADPHFFTGLEHDNVQSLWQAIKDVTWSMTLFVPATRYAEARKLTAGAKNLQLAKFNFVGVEGFDWFERLAYRTGMAMPRPRNVLIPALMCAIHMGYRHIAIVGADHSWLETIRVTDENHVVSVQPHFYADSGKELRRSETEYRGYHLHDILLSFYTAFRSYHRLQQFALSRGLEITNATPGSYIDAFSRKSL